MRIFTSTDKYGFKSVFTTKRVKPFKGSPYKYSRIKQGYVFSKGFRKGSRFLNAEVSNNGRSWFGWN